LALTKPILTSPIIPFPATENHIIKFSSSGSQVVYNEIEIYTSITSPPDIPIFSEKIQSFVFEHLIPLNTLTNNTEYKVRIRTYDVTNITYSSWSDWVVFFCFSIPVVTIDNIIDETINNQTFTFNGSCTTQDPLNSYKYLLYDENQTLIQAFSELFDGLLEQEITGLDNGEKKYLELKVITDNNMEGTSGLIEFTPIYIQPRLASAINLENYLEQGSIKITANIIQIIGHNIGSISYENDEWVVIPNGSTVYFDMTNGFSLSKDFTLDIWCKGLTEDLVFLKLMSDYGYIDFIYYENKIHCFKHLYNNGIIPHYASNILEFILTDNIYIHIEQINDALSLQIGIIA